MICIITVYRSPNFGSILQAKALRDTLLKYDDNVVFLDGNFRPWIYKFQIKGIIRNLCRLRFKHSWYILQKIWNNYKIWKQLPAVSLKEIEKRHDITVVLGSDEIWNVARKECCNPLYWGCGLSSQRIISFSPSINNATIERLKSETFVEPALKSMFSISVRDAYSQNVIRQVSQRNVVQTIDPTLLYGYEYYSKAICPKLPYKYIALYVFIETLTKSDIDNIIIFAKKRNLKIACLSALVPWCDECIRIDGDNPFLYYRDAEYVITNTFHGTAFAINFETQFVSLPSPNNNKVSELLASFGLKERIVTGMCYNDFQKVLLNKIEYDQANKIRIEMKEKSLQYIKNAML